jgi:ERCC4-type nuclease
MIILVDTREQAPFLFRGRHYDHVETMPAALPTGDYSLPGFEDRIAVERKSLDDLIGCLMNDNRDRFERELFRAAPYELFTVVVEASVEDVRLGRFTSKMKPHSVFQSLAAFQVRYRVPFMFCGSRTGAEYWTYSLFDKYLKDIKDRMEIVRNGQDIAV